MTAERPAADELNTLIEEATAIFREIIIRDGETSQEKAQKNREALKELGTKAAPYLPTKIFVSYRKDGHGKTNIVHYIPRHNTYTITSRNAKGQLGSEVATDTNRDWLTLSHTTAVLIKNALTEQMKQTQPATPEPKPAPQLSNK